MTTHEVDVVVLGLGPGGEYAAKKLAEAGLDVVGVEDRLVGGECPFYGCVPSKMMIARRRRCSPRRGGSPDLGRRRATVTPGLGARSRARIRDEATDDWDDEAARRAARGGRRPVRPRPRPARRARAGCEVGDDDVRRRPRRRAQHRHRARAAADRRPGGDAVLDQPRGREG